MSSRTAPRTAPHPAPRRRPRLALTLAGALALPVLPVQAQAAPSLWDLISPDRILSRIIQSGIMSLRTQFDVVYGGITVAPLTGTVTLTDLRAWPPVAWPVDNGCDVRAGRLTLRSVPVDEIDMVRVKVQMTGASAGLDCLPPPMRGVAQSLGIDRVALSRVTMDADYRISTATAATHVYALADGLGSVSLDSDFDYLWFNGRDDMQHPKPVAILKSARLSIENLGAWEKIAPMLPPPVSDPAQSDDIVDAFFQGALPPPPEGVSPSDQRAELIASAKTAWRAFLADPKTLVLETGFDQSSPRLLNVLAWNKGPDPVLDDLQPRVAVTAAATRALLPTALIQKALETPDQLSDDERLQVGTAFASGTGAPRDLATAATLLGPLADAGNGDAALPLAMAMESGDPETAYALALTAAAADAPGAAGLLDRLERALPFATVLTLQGKAVAGVDHPTAALASVATIRAEAAKRLTGTGATRSYATAELWALLGAAAGDSESADMLDEIDQKVRYGGADAAAVWQTQHTEAVDLARQAWVGFDLPTTFRGQE